MTKAIIKTLQVHIEIRPSEIQSWNDRYDITWLQFQSSRFYGHQNFLLDIDSVSTSDPLVKHVNLRTRFFCHHSSLISNNSDFNKDQNCRYGLQDLKRLLQNDKCDYE